jgi:hypothetical protein
MDEAARLGGGNKGRASSGHDGQLGHFLGRPV